MGPFLVKNIWIDQKMDYIKFLPNCKYGITSNMRKSVCARFTVGLQSKPGADVFTHICRKATYTVVYTVGSF